MRASRQDDDALDPVEQERLLIAREQAGGQPAQRASKTTFLSKLAIGVALALVVAYLALWARAVQAAGGPDGYVRITDFIAPLTGAVMIRDGEGPLLYDLEAQQRAQSRIRAPFLPPLVGKQLLPNNHVPFESLAVAPFVGLPYAIAFGLWTLAAGLAVGLALGVMDGVLPVSHPGGWVMSLAACSYYALVRALMLGQDSPFVLLGLCGTYAALKKGYSGWAGVALLLVSLKPQVLPVVLLLLLLQRQWKTLFTFGGLLVALCVAVMPVLGAAWPLQYARLIVGVSDWSDTNAIDPAIMHNWRGFATNLFGGWAHWLVAPVYVLLSLLWVGLLVWVWRRWGGATSLAVRDGAQAPGQYRPAFDLLWALAGLVAVLTSLHLNPHDLTLLIFPGWILGAYALSGMFKGRLGRAWLPALWAGYALAPLTLLPSASLVVVPSVLLMALASVLLARQVPTAGERLRA